MAVRVRVCVCVRVRVRVRVRVHVRVRVVGLSQHERHMSPAEEENDLLEYVCSWWMSLCCVSFTPC